MKTQKTQKLMITYPFNLRGLQPKIDTISSTPLCTGWMVFLNKKATLAHIMHKDDTDSYIRMKVPPNVLGKHHKNIENWFHTRLVGRYIL